MPHSFEAIAPDWKMSPERSIPSMPVSIQLEAYKSKQPPTSCKTIPENCIANDFGGRKTKHFMDMNHYSQLHRLLKKRPRASTKTSTFTHHASRLTVEAWKTHLPTTRWIQRQGSVPPSRQHHQRRYDQSLSKTEMSNTKIGNHFNVPFLEG